MKWPAPVLEPPYVRQQKDPTDGWLKVLSFVVVWGAALTWALQHVSASSRHRPSIWTASDYSLRYGYTFSLVLLVIPLVGLVCWYFRSLHSDHQGDLRKLIRGTLIDSIFAGALLVVFDVLFANLLFTFPDPNAIVRVYVPGYKWDAACSSLLTIFRPSCYSLSIPIEEVLFYLLGAAVLRGMYVWASEDFLSLYTLSHKDYVCKATSCRRVIQVHKPLALVTLLIIAVAVAVKVKHGPGLPVYILLEVAILFLPLVLLFKKVSPFINTRAFLTVMILQVLVSLVWEATMAVPYGWWDYHTEPIIGLTVMPWSELPIEACFFWVAVGWSAMFLHEVTKIKVRGDRSWWGILTGSDARPCPDPLEATPSTIGSGTVGT
jgi:hypothetical protein